ncbi:MAG: CPBP family intramembrane metalloprotease [Prevotellaceae bacterium]|jgi:membrane protease YdiL (CAAX protease family)|nr:CPBP family intramembrane metalloprotease [Prevotellaceae bacterium]
MKRNNIISNKKKPLLKGWIRALLIIIPFLVFTGVLQIIGRLLLGLNPQTEPTFVETTVIHGINAIGTLLLVFIFTRYLDRKKFKSIGFKRNYAGDIDYIIEILLGIIIGSLIITLGAFILIVLNEVKVTEIEFNLPNVLISMTFFAFVAINEEILMRGYILNNFLQSMNKYLALVLSSLIFALLHLLNPSFNLMGFISILFAGMLLGFFYIHTKSLWFALVLHFCWNFFQGTIFGFKVSGNPTYSIISQHPVKNNILNGGEFGFEGSIFSPIFIAIAILVIWWIFIRKPKNDLDD